MSKTRVDFKWNQSKITQIQRAMVAGMLNMGQAVASKARRNAPYDTGALRNSIRTSVEGNGSVYVLAGGSVGGKTIRYARIQEYGGWTGRGHRTLITGHMYMNDAFDEVKRGDIAKYFKGVA